MSGNLLITIFIGVNYYYCVKFDKSSLLTYFFDLKTKSECCFGLSKALGKVTECLMPGKNERSNKLSV